MDMHWFLFAIFFILMPFLTSAWPVPFAQRPNSSHEVHFAPLEIASFLERGVRQPERRGLFGNILRTDTNFIPVPNWELPNEKTVDLNRSSPDGACTLELCVAICREIHGSIAHLHVQCVGKDCFCFVKDEIYPWFLIDFLRKVKLFGFNQHSE